MGLCRLPVMSCRPSGEYVAHDCSPGNSQESSPRLEEFTSHSRRVLSSLAEAMYEPFGEN